MNTLQTFLRVVLYGVRAFRRNVWLSIIAIVTMTMTLLIISVFALGDIVVRQQYQSLNQKIDYLIFLKDEATDSDVTTLVTQIKAQPEVASATLVSKEEGRKEFERLFQDDAELQGVITADDNPIPREVTVHFIDPQSIAGFNTFASQDKFKSIILSTSYQGNATEISRYVRIVNFLKLVGIAATASFIFISVLVVLNTIRLTIHSRRDEIEVMRLVGATPSYIRGPFIVEGIFYGVMAALIAAFASWGLLTQLENLIIHSFNLGTDAITAAFGTSLGDGGATTVSTILSYLFVIQLSVGVVLGSICSFIAVRRYLKE